MNLWKQMVIPTIIMAVVCVGLMAVAYYKGKHVEGLTAAWNIFLPIIPLLFFAFIVAGMVQVLIPKEWAAKWLGEESGWKGIMLGCLAGGITPGGPFIQYPIIAALWHRGVGVGVLVAYVTAWSLWAVNRLPLEWAILGPKFMVARLASTILFPPLAGYIAHLLFSKWAVNPPGS
jgi:uncharacterized membrane protein YraQ (UPF0718 family)